MTLAARIREFIETLFSSRLVVQLRHDLDEARTQRDYFKGRAERLELQLLQPRIAARQAETNSPSQRAHVTGTLGGRKTWAQVVRERREQLADAAKKAEGKKTSAPAPSAQN